MDKLITIAGRVLVSLAISAVVKVIREH